MAEIVIVERVDSRRVSDGSANERSCKYIVTGSVDQAAVLLALRQQTPTGLDGLARSLITAVPVTIDTSTGEGRWDAEVKYTPFASPEPPQVGELNHSFEISAGQMHTTHARKHISDTATAGGAAESFNGAINVEGNGENVRVVGVGVDIPIYTFGLTTVKNDAQVSPQWIGQVYRLVSLVNNAPFKGCDIGECRFLGLAGSKHGFSDWEISMRFAASPNVADVCADWPAAIKPAAAVAKKGWEYFWVRYAIRKGDTTYIPKPQSVHVEQVYGYGNYGILGIGV